MRQLRRWKRLWRRSLTCSHKRTSMGPSRSCCNGTTSVLQPEEIPSKGARVSWVYYQYRCPYQKSLETYLMILVYIYIYIYTSCIDPKISFDSLAAGPDWPPHVASSLGGTYYRHRIDEHRLFMVDQSAHTYLKRSVFPDIHIYQPLRSGKIWHNVNF